MVCASDQVDRHGGSSGTPTPAEHLGELDRGPHALSGGKHGPPWIGAGAVTGRGRAGLGGELGAALATATGQDRATGPRLHAQPKAMRLRATAVVRLEGALAHGGCSCFSGVLLRDVLVRDVLVRGRARGRQTCPRYGRPAARSNDGAEGPVTHRVKHPDRDTPLDTSGACGQLLADRVEVLLASCPAGFPASASPRSPGWFTGFPSGGVRPSAPRRNPPLRRVERCCPAVACARPLHNLWITVWTSPVCAFQPGESLTGPAVPPPRNTTAPPHGSLFRTPHSSLLRSRTRDRLPTLHPRQ